MFDGACLSIQYVSGTRVFLILSRRDRVILLVGALAICSAALRLPALRALPVFGDEAIYLRLARIVRAAPLEQLWVSLRAPSAPLHVWFLGLALPLSADPVLTGRLVSVFFGVLLVLCIGGTVDSIGRAFGDDPERSPVAALSACSLAAISPFLVFNDRIARVESLFALETLLAAWLSVSIASRARPLAPALAFGALMGATMLTRQAVSYPLWLLPAVAFVCRGRRDWRALVLPLGLAVLIAVLLWLPMLTVAAWPDLSTRIFHLGVTRPSLPAGERAALFGRNLATAAAAFWAYLTPPVFLASVAGLALLAAKRRRLFGFLAAWGGLLLVPAALFAVDYFPRYAVPAALPLLAVAGFEIAFAWTRLKGWTRLAVAALLIAWPLFDIARGFQDWKSWCRLPVDRRQFVSGWSAGFATQRAAAFLADVARSGPITVIVPHVSGNPSDAVWLLLDGNPAVRLLYAEDFLRRPALQVKGDVWTGGPAATLDPHRPAYFVSQDPVFLGPDGWAPAVDVVPRRNPNAREVARFRNPPDERGVVESAVDVFRLR